MLKFSFFIFLLGYFLSISLQQSTFSEQNLDKLKEARDKGMNKLSELMEENSRYSNLETINRIDEIINKGKDRLQHKLEEAEKKESIEEITKTAFEAVEKIQNNFEDISVEE